MSILLRSICAVLLTVVFFQTYSQTDGSLDPSFSSDGMVRTSIHTEDRGNVLALTPEGKTVVAGQTLIGSAFVTAVVRYNTDGSLDNSFSGDGIAEVNVVPALDGAEAVTVQPDGKILLISIIEQAGEFNFALLRFKVNGTLDSSFDADGKRLINFGSGDDMGRDIALQSDGKIVVAGHSFNGSNADAFIARFNADGTFDNTFNGTGYRKIPVGSNNDYALQVEIQTDGKIVTGGYTTDAGENIFLIRVNPSGTLDNSFSGDGISVSTWSADLAALNLGSAFALELQDDGKIVMSGSIQQSPVSVFGSWMALARYNTDGSLDNSFDGDGVDLIEVATSGFDVTESINDIVIQNDGKILGTATSFFASTNFFMAVRVNPNGSVDETFGTGGFIQTDIASDDLEDVAGAIALDSSGEKFTMAGFSYNGSNNDFAAARYFTGDETAADPCTTAPTGLFADHITPVKVTLHWSSETSAIKYKVQYRPAGTLSWTSVNSVTNSKKLNGLSPATTYEWRVLSVCPPNSPWSLIQTFTTLPMRQGESVSDVLIYPNPAHEIIYIVGNTEDMPLYIMDISGKIVSSGNVLPDGSYSIKGLSSGLYFISIGMTNQSRYKLIVE